jgi:chitin disaccharide deacetylase
MTRRLILNADDFGYDPAVTKGIAEAMRSGVVSSTTLIVNSPWSEDAAAQSEGLAIGLHLNLVRFQSVSEPSQELTERAVLERQFVVRETRAQLERFTKLLGRPATHIDVHKHAHREPSVLGAIGIVAREHKLPVRSVDAKMRAILRDSGVRTNDEFVGDAGDAAYWTPERWLAELDDLPNDGVVEFMCHPGHKPSHVSSGYGHQREVELATFLSPAAREALTSRGLTLESWAGV